jgi:hypothetical protein
MAGMEVRRRSECSTRVECFMERRRESLIAHIESLAGAVNLCMSQGYVLPTLLLIYASIDMLASLVRAEDQADVSREDYVRWVDKYLIPAGKLPCTALEIYGARCGLLHSYGADSRLNREGKVRLIAYARGAYSGPTEIATSAGESLVVVHVSDLFGGWHRGAEAFLKDLAEDSVLAERAYRRAGRLYSVRGVGDSDLLPLN